MKYEMNGFEIVSQGLKPLALNSWGRRISMPDHPMRCYKEIIQNKLVKCAKDQPILVFLHGKGYSPFYKRSNAQTDIYPIWAQRFAPITVEDNDYLCIGYGWDASSEALINQANYRDVYDKAHQEAQVFANFIKSLKDIAPTQSIHVICEGLGARVFIQSLRHFREHTIKRVIMCNGHEMNADGLSALVAKNAKAIDFYNIIFLQDAKTNRKANGYLPGNGPSDQIFAKGFKFKRRNWKDLYLSGQFKNKHIHKFNRGSKKNETYATMFLRDDLVLRHILFKAKNTAPDDIKVQNPIQGHPSPLNKAFHKILYPIRLLGLYPEFK